MLVVWHSLVWGPLIFKKGFLKILAIRSSYNKKREQEKNFECRKAKIENVLKLWRMRDNSVEGKIVNLKTKAIWKMVCLAL